jgi:cupin domain
MTRRIVTGHDARGNAIIVSDDPSPPRIAGAPGVAMRFDELWATESTPTVPGSADITPDIASLLPGPGATRFRTVLFPPDAERADTTPEQLVAFMASAPGFPEVMEPDRPGMHTTDTVDYGIVISGEIDLELDDGLEVHMVAGDCVVQNGTRHAWHNRTDSPTVMAFIMIGARRA